jgi:hypothetical protein
MTINQPLQLRDSAGIDGFCRHPELVSGSLKILKRILNDSQKNHLTDLPYNSRSLRDTVSI